MDAYTSVVQIQVLLSAIFIFLGATVFFISSLISGHNLFRDTTPQLALLISAIVGFVLFAFSPISFIVFAPNLYGIAGSLGGELYLGIHQRIVEVFWPFMCSAIGLGALFGGLEAINARTLFLHWLRRFIRLRYPILSYEKSWDNFMLSLKKGGRIRVVQEDGKSCEGQLKSASIKDEPQQITLNCDGKYKLIEARDIAYIEADKKSFNRHLDVVPHQAEGFYLAIAAFGLLVLAGSASQIAAYFTGGITPYFGATLNAPQVALPPISFEALSGLYYNLAWALLGFAILFIGIAFRASWQNFRRLCSYLALCPLIPSVLLFELWGSLAVALFIWLQPFQTWPNRLNLFWAYLGASVFVLGLIVWFVCYLRRKGRKVDGLIDVVAGTNNDEQTELLRKVCQFIYLEVDLDRAAPTKWSDISDILEASCDDSKQHELLKRLHEEIKRLTRSEAFLWVSPDMYLKNEDFNIALRLLRKLEKDLDRIPPGLASAPDEPEGISIQTTEAEYVRVRYRRT